MRRIVTVALVVGLMFVAVVSSARPADAMNINFSLQPPWDGFSSNRGTSLAFTISGVTLTLTAKSTLGDAATDALADTDLNHVGTIFWGNLDDLGGGCGGMSEPDCIGLGVQDKNKGGSKGISGDGGDANEALIFSFTGGTVDAFNTSITLIGLNCDDMTGSCTGGMTDFLDLNFEFLPVDPGTDLTKLHVSFVDGCQPCVIDFNQFPQLQGQTFGSFAVLAEQGHFGVRGVTTPDAVPEPGTLVLLGVGLAGLGTVARRISRRRSVA
jgi:hypothetical protein